MKKKRASNWGINTTKKKHGWGKKKARGRKHYVMGKQTSGESKKHKGRIKGLKKVQERKPN